jgi:D-alanine-D-alanine ligase
MSQNENSIESKTIGVFFGSRTPEHDVSIITACLVIDGLKTLGYSVVPVYLSKDGSWFIHESLGSIDFYKDPTYPEKLDAFPHYQLSLDFSHQGLVFQKKSFLRESNIKIDLAFPCFHGPNGEDGTMQGLFEIAQIPYVGCGVLTSAVTMDKVITKEIYTQHSIPTSDFVYFSKNEWSKFENDIKEQINQIGYPVFVKPPRSGSSIGISKVVHEKDLQNAVNLAFKFDHKVLVEKSVENLADLTVAVLGNYLVPESLVASAVQESRFDDHFFSYEEKYLAGGAHIGGQTKNIIIPADIDEKIIATVQTMAKHIYKVFECTGTARIDFLYNRSTGKLYANEINTLPGTLYHHLWKQSGVSLGDLLRILLKSADEAFNARNALTYSFSSNILKYVSGGKLSKKI